MRREKIAPAIRRKTVTEIETGRLSQGEAAKRLNVGRATIQGWLSKYRSEGSSGLSLDGHSCLRLTLLTVVRVVDLRQLVVAYVGRISLKREPQVNKPAVRALNYYLYKNFRHSTHTGI